MGGVSRRPGAVIAVAWLPLALHLTSWWGLGWGLGAARTSVSTLLCCCIGLVVWSFRGMGRPGMVALFLTSTGTGLWYAYPGTVLVWSEAYRQQALTFTQIGDRDLTAVAAVLLFFGCCTTLSQIGMRGAAVRPARRQGRQLSPRRLASLGLIYVVLGVAPLVVLSSSLRSAIEAVGESRHAEKDWVTTDNVGNARSALLVLTSSLGVAGGAALLVGVLHPGVGRLGRGASLCLGLAVGFVFALDTGTRAVAVLLFLPPFGAWLIDRTLQRKGRIGVWIGAGAIGLFVAQNQLLTLRGHYGAVDGNRGILDVITLSGTIDFFSETLLSFTFVPQIHGFFHENSVVMFLTNPIPRFLWPGKPLSEVAWDYAFWRSNIDIYAGGGNILSGVVGQEYMSWGWLGVIEAALVIGLVAAWLERIAARAVQAGEPAVLAAPVMAGAWLVLCFRMLSPGLVYPVVAFFALLRLAQVRPKGAVVVYERCAPLVLRANGGDAA